MVSLGDVDSFTFLSPLWVVVGWKVVYGFVVSGYGMGVGKKYFLDAGGGSAAGGAGADATRH